jgi:hypothetical protein
MLRVDVVRELEGGVGVVAAGVDVWLLGAVAVRDQRPGVDVCGPGLGVVVDDEPRLRNDPAGEEAREHGYGEARGGLHPLGRG